MDNMTKEIAVPNGVKLISLTVTPDRRGTYAEIFREIWNKEANFIQWNAAMSHEGVLRGPHFHLKHHDYIVLIQGMMTVGLRDLRRNSPTENLVSMFRLSGNEMTALIIPPGVLHGFFFHSESIYIQGASEYWDSDDDIGIHWSDPALQIPWPTTSPILSDKDATSPFLSEIADRLPTWQPLS